MCLLLTVHSWVSIKTTSNPSIMCPDGYGGWYNANQNRRRKLNQGYVGFFAFDGGSLGDGCYVKMDEFTTVRRG